MDYYATFDNYKVGQLQAEALTDIIMATQTGRVHLLQFCTGDLQFSPTALSSSGLPAVPVVVVAQHLADVSHMDRVIVNPETVSTLAACDGGG